MAVRARNRIDKSRRVKKPQVDAPSPPPPEPQKEEPAEPPPPEGVLVLDLSSVDVLEVVLPGKTTLKVDLKALMSSVSVDNPNKPPRVVRQVLMPGGFRLKLME